VASRKRRIQPRWKRRLAEVSARRHVTAGGDGAGQVPAPRQGPLAAVTDLRFAGALVFAGAAALVGVDFGQVPMVVSSVGGGIQSAAGSAASAVGRGTD